MSDLERLTIQSYRGPYFVDFCENGFASAAANVEGKEFVVLVDAHVHDLYEEHIKKTFPAERIIRLDASERLKDLDRISDFLKTLLDRGVKKTTEFIAIGGGAVQDTTAFVASILFRGIKWHFVPSNLLTQCDSCIGSKTSVNLAGYKNVLGGFYPPSQIYIDYNFLKTLEETELRSGLGEMFHYFLFDSEESFEFGNARIDKTLEGDIQTISELIHRSLAIKAKIIEQDEFDTHIRNHFNYGHTFGHAMESGSGYSIPHGIAVSFGMDIANFISCEEGMLKPRERLKIREQLSRIWGSANPATFTDVEKMIKALEHDKKNTQHGLRCILSEGIGDLKIKTMQIDDLGSYIRRYFDEKLWRN